METLTKKQLQNLYYVWLNLNWSAILLFLNFFCIIIHAEMSRSLTLPLRDTQIDENSLEDMS